MSRHHQDYANYEKEGWHLKNQKLYKELKVFLEG